VTAAHQVVVGVIANEKNAGRHRGSFAIPPNPCRAGHVTARALVGVRAARALVVNAG